MKDFEQEEQLAAFCVDPLFWQKDAQYIQFGEDRWLVCSIKRVGGKFINPKRATSAVHRYVFSPAEQTLRVIAANQFYNLSFFYPTVQEQHCLI